MRKYNKKQCSELIETLEEAHREIAKCIEKDAISAASSLLADCQDAAVSIGNIIESSEGEGTEAVRRLENYCELVYQINEELISGKKVNARNAEKHLRRTILGAQSSINALPTRYEAVFFPYKASMWDSLESIWMAADEDPNCDAYVVPIPYYDRNPDGTFARLHYEADLYPDYVPITGYAQYNLEEHHPDMIYIHNPYDEYNYVTSVHPNFYSRVLKQYTDCLVYVPYYATSGKMAEGHGFCPSYMIVDYIVVQSKIMIEQFDERVPREKFLPLGSPKFDRVIRLCKNPPEPPAGWKKKMAGKKVFFYNTSISGMLANTEFFLKKMDFVFHVFRDNENACIIWRPHPLLQSTFESMRRAEFAEYERLKEKFIEDDIGIYDATPDIEKTIAYCDAYLGDDGSSVLSMFMVANKEIYTLNQSVHDYVTNDVYKADFYVGPNLLSEFNKYVLLPFNKLFLDENDDGKYGYLCDLTDYKDRWGYLFGYRYLGDKGYIFPCCEQNILSVDKNGIQNKTELRKVDLKGGSFFMAWIVLKKYAFLIPDNYPYLVRFDLQTAEVDYIDGVRDFYQETVRTEKFISAVGYIEDKLYFLNPEGSKILQINAETLEKTYIDVEFGMRIERMVSERYDSEYFWLFPEAGKKLIRWNRIQNSQEIYEINLEDIKSINPDTGAVTEIKYFLSLIRVNEDVIVAPLWGNKFVKINLISKETEEWHPFFPIDSDKEKPYFNSQEKGVFQKSYDVETGNELYRWISLKQRRFFDIYPEDESFHEIEVSINREDLEREYAVGFRYNQNQTVFFCGETIFNPLENIVGGNIKGEQFALDAQKKLVAKICANSDGNSGKEVYEKTRNI